MKRCLQVFVTVAALVCLPVMSVAEKFSGFSSGFAVAENSQRKSYTYVADPTGSAPSTKVHSFNLGAGCTTKDDCDYQSARTQLHERERQRPASDGWYGWWMYIPKDFVIAEEQPSKGYYTFAQWKNHGCPHVSFRNIPVNAYVGVVENVDPDMIYIETLNQFPGQDCSRKARVPVVSIDELRGGWHKFEVYAEWSHSKDGRFVVYVDGVKRVDYTGSNQTEGWDENYFQFGIYLCCTKNVDEIQPVSVFYSNVSKSPKREKLR